MTTADTEADIREKIFADLRTLWPLGDGPTCDVQVTPGLSDGWAIVVHAGSRSVTAEGPTVGEALTDWRSKLLDLRPAAPATNEA